VAKVPKLSDLALNGGKPLHTRPWRTGAFHFAQELSALEELLSGPALPLARGRAVMAYRQELQALYGMKYAVPTSSGSAAIHVGLFAAGVGAGDEVIVSPLTDYGSIMGIFQLNAIPVFADVQPDGLLMDVKSVAEKITPHTRLIMPVHNGGYAVDMPALMRLARKHGLMVLEDCAQSHLASLKGRYLGTFGQLAAWSTNESKHMKSGEGGFLLTNDRRMAELADLFSDKCYPRFPGAPPTPAFPALNVRLSDVNAALARVQLRRLPKWTAQRQAFGLAFYEGIAGVPGIKPQPQPKGALPSFWWALFAVDPKLLGVDAGRLCEMVKKEGIPCAAGQQRYVPGWEVFRALDRNPHAFRSYRPGRLKKGFYPLDVAPDAQSAAERLGFVSMTQHNTPAEARAAARALRKVVGALLGKAL
jgi:dTDP-4-amino-4,6-dideoxygalactose transaminase